MNHEPGVSQLTEGETGIPIQASAASESNHKPISRAGVVSYTSCPDVNVGNYGRGAKAVSYLPGLFSCSIIGLCLSLHMAL